jgi:hypothetical protein
VAFGERSRIGELLAFGADCDPTREIRLEAAAVDVGLGAADCPAA